MSALYSAVEWSLFLLGLTSLLTWTAMDSAVRDGVSTHFWTASALFLPAVIFYAVFVRTRHPRRRTPTRLERAALSLAIAILGWRLLELWYAAAVPRNTTIAVITLFSILSFAATVYVSLGAFWPRNPESSAKGNPDSQ
ncbi:hypothetical protein [Halomicrobium zhouii]|uniref:hypothetical protein n=1 Tax=Halomicrobium zhouii TaxID=767519 RepID=UPI000B7FFDDC|nr:hypothetical protein [Halomicrobium zhouii]